MRGAGAAGDLPPLPAQPPPGASAFSESPAPPSGINSKLPSRLRASTTCSDYTLSAPRPEPRGTVVVSTVPTSTLSLYSLSPVLYSVHLFLLINL